MTQSESNDFNAFGLTGADVEVDEFTWPDAEAAEGKPSLVVWGIVELFSLGRFSTINIPLMERAGIHIEASLDRRGAFRISTPRGVEIEGASGVSVGKVHVDPVDRGIGVFALTVDSRVVISLSDGRVVAFAFDGNRMKVGLGSDASPFLEVRAPDVASWCERVGDVWLRDYLGAYVAREDPWHSTLAVALFLRLRELTADQARVAVGRLVSGQEDPDIEPALDWVASLTQAQVAAVFSLALAEADALITSLEHLESLVDDPSDLWREVLGNIAVRRDDLEAVRVVLRTVSRSALDELQAVVDYLDSIGMRTVASLPERADIVDVRLRRVSVADPLAWWVSLVIK